MFTKLFGTLAIASGLMTAGVATTAAESSNPAPTKGACCSADCCKDCPDCKCDCACCENCEDGCDCPNKS
jgi:hypothetical protein